MLWEKINAKTFVTILFFKIFGKTSNFAVLICYAVPVAANQYILIQKYDPLDIKFSAELNKLTPSL